MKIQLSEIIASLEDLANPSLQEHYDNAGLIIGDFKLSVNKALIALDITESVIDEAIAISANLIIVHHPIIFGGIKKLNGSNYIERCVIKAIKNDIAIYAIHTNLDNLQNGTNTLLAKRLGLKSIETLQPLTQSLVKLVTFCPESHAEIVKQAIFDAGAGSIGNYDCCSFNVAGKGTFRAGLGSNPFVGELKKLHIENEIRIETVLPKYLLKKVVNAMTKIHPYEEVAYDVYSIQNEQKSVGVGIIGYLDTELEEMDFLNNLKKITQTACIRHTALLGKKIKKVALCGGSGAFLIKNAKQKKADIYITADIKYHEFFDADGEMILADIGHYESEKFIKELLISYINEKFPTFAVQISDIDTNPINYL